MANLVGLSHQMVLLERILEYYGIKAYSIILSTSYFVIATDFGTFLKHVLLCYNLELSL